MADVPEPLPPLPPGVGVAQEDWTWELHLTADETAVVLQRDGVDKLTIPLSPDQCETLMGQPALTVLAAAEQPGEPS